MLVFPSSLRRLYTKFPDTVTGPGRPIGSGGQIFCSGVSVGIEHGGAGALADNAHIVTRGALAADCGREDLDEAAGGHDG